MNTKTPLAFCALTLSIAALACLILPSRAAELGTRQRTICPVPLEAPVLITASNVAAYAETGYSTWEWGAGVDGGRYLDLMPAGYSPATNAARLLSFFAFADVHLTDKESPAQVPYMGWTASTTNPGPANLNPSAYSAVVLATSQRLNAAVKTVNRTHQLLPFDFGIILGDVCNSGQYNELRWFIDVMDGQWINPDSGAPEAEPEDGLSRSLPSRRARSLHSLVPSLG